MRSIILCLFAFIAIVAGHPLSLHMSPPAPYSDRFPRQAFYRNYRPARNPQDTPLIHGLVDDLLQLPSALSREYLPASNEPVSQGYGAPPPQSGEGYALPRPGPLPENIRSQDEQDLTFRESPEPVEDYPEADLRREEPLRASASAGTGFSSVECQMRQAENFQFKFVCEGVDPSAITLKSDQILWLQNPMTNPQTVDIEVPNYKIEDWIKAYFKEGTRSGNNRININLKRPQQSWEAAAQMPSSAMFKPQVSLNYERSRPPKTIHYPRDAPYQRGPLPNLRE